MAHIPAKQIRPFRNMSEGMLILGSLAPERLTIGQAAFFIEAALADMQGTPLTPTELSERLGVSRSIQTTYRVFVGEGRRRGGGREPGLGWLVLETDRDDNRRKFIRLTAKGRDVLARVEVAMAKAGK